MKLQSLITATAGVLVAMAAHAATPAAAPAGTTGLCKDGTYYSGAEKKGACRGHKGVKDWYGDSAAAKTNATATSAGAATVATTPAPGSAGPVPAKPSGTSAGTASTRAAAPVVAKAATGGGPGSVWVNASTKVYHCPTDQWYGKTKTGEYMSEGDARAKGFHAAHGEKCGP